jgi:hypothetical protein
MARTTVFAFAVAAFLAPHVASATVSCDQVMKELKAGRTPQDVGDALRVSSNDIQKCQIKAADRRAREMRKSHGAEEVPGGMTAAPDGSKAH